MVILNLMLRTNAWVRSWNSSMGNFGIWFWLIVILKLSNFWIKTRTTGLLFLNAILRMISSLLFLRHWSTLRKIEILKISMLTSISPSIVFSATSKPLILRSISSCRCYLSKRKILRIELLCSGLSFMSPLVLFLLTNYHIRLKLLLLDLVLHL